MLPKSRLGVLLALVDEDLVADLPRGTREEPVFEVGLEERPPEVVENACEPVGAPALAGGNDYVNVLRGERLRARPGREGEGRCGRGAGKQAAATWIAGGHAVSSLWVWEDFTRPRQLEPRA